jgi:hypothetical protein
MCYILKLSTPCTLAVSSKMNYSFVLIYSSLFSLMMAIYSRNMQLVYTPIKLCLDCGCAFLFLICVQYVAYFK